jgi:hypothetical protein
MNSLLDGFQNAVEGDDSPANRLIQGKLVKFTKPPAIREEIDDEINF